jgi:hypothetical protein
MALSPAQLAKVQTTLDNYVTTLATESANPRPSYTVGSQTLDWPAYAQFLQQQIDTLDLFIQQQQDNRGAWEVRSRGLP